LIEVSGRAEVERFSEQVRAPGDRTLGDLYVRYSPGGLRLAYALTGDRELAEELVQEAFARLIARLRHLRDPAAFDAYLRRTIVNLANSLFRRRAIERARMKLESGSPQPETREPDVVGFEAMRHALLGLPQRQRAAIVLRFYEDLSEGQIADVLRCRPGTVRSLMSRGMATLRSNLGSEIDA
jgi:RNA polymerase sigma-70 factor (sigma-E family)